MFWKKNKVKEKKSLEDMFTPREEVEESLGEKEEHKDFECDKEEKKSDVVKQPKKPSAPIKPTECFGIEEEKTDKWLGKCVKFWFWCMSFMWFLFGALTFAPVIFIANKVDVIFNDKKKSLFVATIMHGVLLTLIFIFVFS